MKKTVVLIVTVLFLSMLCMSVSAQEEGVPSDFASDPALYVHAVSGSDDSEAWQKWQSVHDEEFIEEKPDEKFFYLPSSAEKDSVDVYNGYDEEIILNGVKILSHTTEAVPYEAGVSYSVAVGAGSYTLTMMNSNAEAAIYINNPDADGSGLDLMSYLNVDKSRSATASGAIVTPDGRIDNTEIKKIKGRGNTSWGKPKKGYNITYDKDVGVAGMDPIKKFALTANYQDDSLSRNRILYDLSDAVGLPYAPESRYVDFYVNGFYWGSYLLSEKIDSGGLLPKIKKSDYLKDDNTIQEDFNFVVEVNPSASDEDYWFSSNGMKISIISPEIDPGDPGYDEVKEYIKEKFDQFYAAASSSDDLSEAADIESLASLYLVNELGKNWDSGAASTFFTYMQDENDVYRFYGSPVWDYDNSMGNATGVFDDLFRIGLTDYEEYTGWWCRNKGRLSAEDQESDNIIARISQNSEIKAAVPVIWFEDFMPALEHFAGKQYDAQIETELKTRDEYFDLIQDSAKMNYASGWLLCTSPWIADHSSLYKAVYDESTQKMIVDASATNYEQVFPDMFNYAVDWTLSRAAWLSEQFAASMESEDPGDCPRHSTCPLTSFTDTDPQAWYHDGVHWALQKKVMNGTGSSTFEPLTSTTRAMTVTMLWRMEGSPVVNYQMTFKDVPDGQWYTEAVRWAASNGVVNGYDEETFGTNENITREQIVTILCRYAEFKGMDVNKGESISLNDFTDRNDISEWADQAFHWAVGAGIIQGMGENTLSPKTDAVRAQVAAMLMRFRFQKDDPTDPPFLKLGDYQEWAKNKGYPSGLLDAQGVDGINQDYFHTPLNSMDSSSGIIVIGDSRCCQMGIYESRKNRNDFATYAVWGGHFEKDRNPPLITEELKSEVKNCFEEQIRSCRKSMIYFFSTVNDYDYINNENNDVYINDAISAAEYFASLSYKYDGSMYHPEVIVVGFDGGPADGNVLGIPAEDFNRYIDDYNQKLRSAVSESNLLRDHLSSFTTVSEIVGGKESFITDGLHYSDDTLKTVIQYLVNHQSSAEQRS